MEQVSKVKKPYHGVQCKLITYGKEEVMFAQSWADLSAFGNAVMQDVAYQQTLSFEEFIEYQKAVSVNLAIPNSFYFWDMLDHINNNRMDKVREAYDLINSMDAQSFMLAGCRGKLPYFIGPVYEWPGYGYGYGGTYVGEGNYFPVREYCC